MRGNQEQLSPAEKPTEHPGEQTTEGLVEQPTEYPAERPDKHFPEQCTERPAERLSEQPEEQSVEQPAEQSVEQPVEQPVGQPAGCLTEQLAEQPDEYPQKQHAEYLAENIAEQPAEQPAEHLTEQLAEQLNENMEEISRLANYSCSSSDVSDNLENALPIDISQSLKHPHVRQDTSWDVPDEIILNQLHLTKKLTLVMDTAALLDSLNFNAVELTIECLGLTRIDRFSNVQCLAAVFVEGSIPGSWDILGKTEALRCTAHIRFITRFRLPAATEIDRRATMKVALYQERKGSVKLNLSEAIGYQDFSVAELLEPKNMSVEKCLKHDKRGGRPRGTFVFSLDMIRHVGHDQKIVLEFGFLKDAPVRNRMFFVVSRALRASKWIPIYRSEVRFRDNLASFEPVTFDSQEFHGGEEGRLFRLEVYRFYKNGKKKTLGFLQTSFQKLKSMEVNNQLYWWPAEDGISCAKVIVKKLTLSETKCFFSLKVAKV